MTVVSDVGNTKRIELQPSLPNFDIGLLPMTSKPVNEPVCGVRLWIKPCLLNQKHREHTRLLANLQTDEFKSKRCKSESLAFLLEE